MKLLEIKVENILAYEGEWTVDLSGTEADRNIILIWGRNGMGKTSFLTAIKLLFTGIAKQEYRLGGRQGAKIEPRQYVLGEGAHWLGLINRRALAKARAAKESVTARVSARWTDGDRRFSADRSWSTDGTTYKEQLVVFDGDERLVREPAEDRLDELLPKDFVNFFFFDGEDVKSMAEDIERKSIDFDRLLRLTFINDLAAELEALASQREGRGAQGKGAADLANTEDDLAKTRRLINAAQDELEILNERLLNDTSELRRLQARRENLGSGASEAQRADLESRRVDVSGRLGTLLSDITSKVPGAAPVLANLRLVATALAAVEDRLKTAMTSEVILVTRIKDQLDGWIEDAAPELPPASRTRLVRSLSERLERLVDAPVSVTPFATLDVARAERLRETLQQLTLAGPSQRNLQAADLEQAVRLQLELDQISEALIRLEVGSQANLEQYRQVMGQLAVVEERMAVGNQRKGALTDRLTEHQTEERRLDERAKTLRAGRDLAVQHAREAAAIRTVARTFNDLRESLRQATRADLQKAINERLEQLIYDHTLIASVELDDTYTMFFKDAQGRRLGRASLSSGLKQLAATALLWAMKDLADRDMPVIIDTPLGRIDRENQGKLLTNYYPNISEQVIVLPTNSEIDAAKLTMLMPRVARQYVIRNADGDSARIELGGLVEPA